MGKPTNSGKRLYECLDCGAKHFVHWTERSRAKRISCANCGGPMDPASLEAMRDVVAGELNVREFDRTRGSIVAAKTARRLG